MVKHRDITDRLENAAANIEEHSGANLYARLMREASDAILQLRNQVADLTSKLPQNDAMKYKEHK